MHNFIIRLSAILTSCFLVISANAALADVIDYDDKVVENCKKLINMNDYDDYYFFLNDEDKLPSSVLLNHETSPECGYFYKLDSGYFAAMKKTDFDTIINEHNYQIIDGNIVAIIERDENNEPLYNEDFQENFSIDNKDYFISSDLEIEFGIHTVKISNPLEKVNYNYQIKSLNDDKLEIELAQVVYTYEDGSTEINNITDTVIPEPEKKIYPWIYYSATGLGLLIIVIIGSIFYLKKRKS